MRSEKCKAAGLAGLLRIPMRGYEGLEKATVVVLVIVTNPHAGL